MVKVAIFGATGKAGSRIQTELLSRGHSVIAIARNAANVKETGANVEVRVTDDLDTADLVPLIQGADVIVHAYAPPFDNVQKLITFTERVIEAVKSNGNTQRLIVVGGAGGLRAGPSGRVIDQPWFPAEWKPIAQAHIDILEILRASTINWTTLTPPGQFAPGERTGKFRLADEDLVANEQGSSISMEDFAIVLVNEIENPEHVRARFTTGY